MISVQLKKNDITFIQVNPPPTLCGNFYNIVIIYVVLLSAQKYLNFCSSSDILLARTIRAKYCVPGKGVHRILSRGSLTYFV